ncbi:putative translation initiation factor IF-2, N-terminal region [Trypoxylus dichotomus]
MTIKQGGENVTVWGCMSWRGVGPIYRIEGIMNQHEYIHILENIFPYANENLPITWKLFHDNDPKHSARSDKDTVIANSISVISCPDCSTGLNPIENLWYATKQKVGRHYYSSLDKLYEAIELTWHSTPPEFCRVLIESMK